MSYLQLICGIAIFFLSIYYYFTSTFGFWKARGINGPKPVPLFGNIADLLLVRKSIPEFLVQLYKEYKHEPMIGIFLRREPTLLLNDTDLIKDVLISDFSNFSDRGFPNHEKAEPLSPHLFNLEPARWRPLRARLSPVFTSGKLKEMFQFILECADQLEIYLNHLVAKGEPIECWELAAKYTTDVIGSCGFGVETHSLSDEESEFRRIGRAFFGPSIEQILRLRARQSNSHLYNLLGYIFPERKATNFFTKLIVDTIKYREENNVTRPDFVSTLMEVKKHPEKLGNIKLTDTLLTAQAFVFFVAGFETSSSTITNALYQLALNPDAQDKVRQEIKEAFEKSDGRLKYEQIKDMTYLDLVFRETLRMYPPVPILSRRAADTYTFRKTNLTIPPGTLIWMPLHAMQNDPDIFPNPDVFIPERFTNDAVAARNPMYYLPFGDGPRNCIGARFAVYQTKMGLITILRNHKVEVCEKTMIPYVVDPGALLPAPKGGIYLTIRKAEC